MNFNLRKTLQVLFYYVMPGISFLIVLWSLITDNYIYDLMVEFGSWSMNLLILILFIRPISVLFDKVVFFKKVMSYRRELGVLAFWFAIFHSLVLAFYLNLFSIYEISRIYDLSDYVSWGVFGFLGMFILGITSNKFSVLKLKRNWKKLQMLAYPTFAFVVVHKVMAEEEAGAFVLLLVYVILKTLEILKVKKKLFWAKKSSQ